LSRDPHQPSIAAGHFACGKGNPNVRAPTDLPTRKRAGTDAGMSAHQYRTAMDVGKVNQAEFDAATLGINGRAGGRYTTMRN